MHAEPEIAPRCRALKIARLALGWSQEALAAAAGIEPTTLSDYERGRKEPSAATLHRLTGCLGLSRGWVDDLLALLAEVGAPPGEGSAEAARAARPLAESFVRRVIQGFLAEIEARRDRRQEERTEARLELYDAGQQLALRELRARLATRRAERTPAVDAGT